MLTYRLASSGPVAQTVEQMTSTFPSGSSGDIVELDIVVKSQLPPGSATYVQITQHQPNFLILHSDIVAIGTLHLHLYYLIDQADPTDFDVHVVVFAHDLEQL